MNDTLSGPTEKPGLTRSRLGGDGGGVTGCSHVGWWRHASGPLMGGEGGTRGPHDAPSVRFRLQEGYEQLRETLGRRNVLHKIRESILWQEIFHINILLFYEKRYLKFKKWIDVGWRLVSDWWSVGFFSLVNLLCRSFIERSPEGNVSDERSKGVVFNGLGWTSHFTDWNRILKLLLKASRQFSPTGIFRFIALEVRKARRN